MNATQFAITDGTDLAEGEDGTCVTLGFTFDAAEDCVESIKRAFRAAGWEIDGNLDFDTTTDPAGDAVLMVYARPAMNTNTSTISFEATLPAGSVDAMGEHDWSGEWVGASVEADGRWMILDAEGASWDEGYAASQAEGLAAARAACGL